MKREGRKSYKWEKSESSLQPPFWDLSEEDNLVTDRVTQESIAAEGISEGERQVSVRTGTGGTP